MACKRSFISSYDAQFKKLKTMDEGSDKRRILLDRILELEKRRQNPSEEDLKQIVQASSKYRLEMLVVDWAAGCKDFLKHAISQLEGSATASRVYVCNLPENIARDQLQDWIEQTGIKPVRIFMCRPLRISMIQMGSFWDVHFLLRHPPEQLTDLRPWQPGVLAGVESDTELVAYCPGASVQEIIEHFNFPFGGHVVGIPKPIGKSSWRVRFDAAAICQRFLEDREQMLDDHRFVLCSAYRKPKPTTVRPTQPSGLSTTATARILYPRQPYQQRPSAAEAQKWSPRKYVEGSAGEAQKWSPQKYEEGSS